MKQIYSDRWLDCCVFKRRAQRFLRFESKVICRQVQVVKLWLYKTQTERLGLQTL